MNKETTSEVFDSLYWMTALLEPSESEISPDFVCPQLELSRA